MKKFILSITLFLAIIQISHAQMPESYGSTLLKMFEVAGTEATYETVIVQMMDMFRSQYPEEHTPALNEMETEMRKTAVEDLAVKLAPIYYKYLSEADLKEVISFYESPVGKKLAEKTPLITAESMLVGQKWGEEMAREVMNRLEE